MKSIDVFNIISFEMFYRCLDNFPAPTFISRSDVASEVHNYISGLSNAPSLQVLDEKVFHTGLWLRDEGYVTDKGSAGEGFSFVLSERGLAALNTKPSSLSGGESFGDEISKGLRDISVGVASGLMIEFFKPFS
ncbi:hypothetical protein ACOMICROBIO_LMKGKHOH_02193 [Vibrio sp. B1FIG11]|uniref:hypothetical protein n=1 Tax=Vibrio sp. B1FIG11 TaxID=2751177 RepID=UPI001AF6A50C|nr:hypothetical protein [Vibrio sp. B1FIG11]CAD7806859.1 hypothetical protein ACOMICROBIO_LMKGKHOH_02193 [Vibrio sp. B1FIG11]CAE6902880.1 hypothetical protein ACOMICROBIO_LMKGKHOH_02193 [Vibrio sp. B1FIG11]